MSYNNKLENENINNTDCNNNNNNGKNEWESLPYFLKQQYLQPTATMNNNRLQV